MRRRSVVSILKSKKNQFTLRSALVCLVLLTAPFRLFAAPWPLGTLKIETESTPACPPAHSCRAFEVECPGVRDPARGVLALAAAEGKPRGLIMFFTGSFGTKWWGEENREGNSFLEELRKLGFSTVQIRWGRGWLVSAAGEDAGTAHLACRPATVIRYVYDQIYAPLGIHNSNVGKAGFCITGNSGGASQVSYALSHYGLDNILDVVIPTGGPPHAAIDRLCLDEFDTKGLPPAMRHLIDSGFGYFNGSGPCVRRDASFKSRWLQESVATGGNDYQHPKTRIHFLIGQRDAQMQVVARVYYDRLRKEGSPKVSWQIVPGSQHLVTAGENGLRALKNAILDNDSD